MDVETKEFHDKSKFIQYLSGNSALQRIIMGKHQHNDGNLVFSIYTIMEKYYIPVMLLD